MYSTTTMTMMPKNKFICIAIFHVYIVPIWWQTAHWPPFFFLCAFKVKNIVSANIEFCYYLFSFFLFRAVPRIKCVFINCSNINQKKKKKKKMLCLLIYSVRQLELQRQNPTKYLFCHVKCLYI